MHTLKINRFPLLNKNTDSYIEDYVRKVIPELKIKITKIETEKKCFDMEIQTDNLEDVYQFGLFIGSYSSQMMDQRKKWN